MSTAKRSSALRFGHPRRPLPNLPMMPKCPSGALSYSIENIEYRDQEREPMVTVTDDGPYAITGAIELIGVTFGDGASKEHYTLCRCGASKNKPFCDGSHWSVGFRDAAR
jgi:hypothetical protein